MKIKNLKYSINTATSWDNEKKSDSKITTFSFSSLAKMF